MSKGWPNSRSRGLAWLLLSRAAGSHPGSNVVPPAVGESCLVPAQNAAVIRPGALPQSFQLLAACLATLLCASSLYFLSPRRVFELPDRIGRELVELPKLGFLPRTQLAWYLDRHALSLHASGSEK